MIIELTEADETQKVNFKEIVSTMMSNTECFSEKLLLSDAIETSLISLGGREVFLICETLCLI